MPDNACLHCRTRGRGDVLVRADPGQPEQGMCPLPEVGECTLQRLWAIRLLPAPTIGEGLCEVEDMVGTSTDGVRWLQRGRTWKMVPALQNRRDSSFRSVLMETGAPGLGNSTMS